MTTILIGNFRSVDNKAKNFIKNIFTAFYHKDNFYIPYNIYKIENAHCIIKPLLSHSCIIITTRFRERMSDKA